jgi:hypothetical protein
MMGSKQDRPDNLISEVANALQGEVRPDRIHAPRGCVWRDSWTRSRRPSRCSKPPSARCGTRRRTRIAPPKVRRGPEVSKTQTVAIRQGRSTFVIRR